MNEFRDIIKILTDHQVEFVIIGGVAANLHGSAYLTSDFDICYRRSESNLKRLSEVLISIHARLRGAPENLPFQPDPPTLKAGLNFTFTTDIVDFDLLSEVGGIGFYDAVVAESQKVEIAGFPCRILTLDALIRAKKFAGRKKDEPMVKELEAIKELKNKD